MPGATHFARPHITSRSAVDGKKHPPQNVNQNLMLSALIPDVNVSKRTELRREERPRRLAERLGEISGFPLCLSLPRQLEDNLAGVEGPSLGLPFSGSTFVGGCGDDALPCCSSCLPKEEYVGTSESPAAHIDSIPTAVHERRAWPPYPSRPPSVAAAASGAVADRGRDQRLKAGEALPFLVGEGDAAESDLVEATPWANRRGGSDLREGRRDVGRDKQSDSRGGSGD